MKRYLIQRIDPRKDIGLVRTVGESDSLSYCLARIKKASKLYQWGEGLPYQSLPKEAEPFLIYRIADCRTEKIVHVAMYFDGYNLEIGQKQKPTN